MRRLKALTTGLAVMGVTLLGLATPAHAQGSSNEGFTMGYMDVGPVLGLGSIGNAGVSFGGRFEVGISQLPSLGNGVLSIAVSLDHYSYNEFNYGWSYTPIGGTVNYHFNLQNRKVDPFIGIGLGDYVVTTPANCPGCSFNSGVYVIGRLGMRYFVSPGLALYGDVGSGAGALHVGVMFRLKQ